MKHRQRSQAMGNFGFKMMALMFKMMKREEKAKVILEELDLQSGEILLDYGCGPGDYCFVAARKIGSDGAIYAADIQPTASKMIKKRAQKEGLDNIIPLVTDCKLDIEDDSVDRVFLFDVYHNFPDPEKIIKELHRVSKKDGQLIMVIDHGDPMPIIREISEFGCFKMFKKNEHSVIMQAVD